ncbi:hypothetical protein [Clostridium sp. D43t1_170807_H7]|uniref:hypothetical protein n=1 Tax=Clostridium sp. D43t1_170807_H7 TaxID=2787140 RepID=UPI0018995492|nr:hypothetical protein [Clostridium sp. D43t1_170807_H7]
MRLKNFINNINPDNVENLKLIGGFIFTIISGVYFVVNYFYNQMYKQKNQSYYGIPSKYFQGSIEDKIFYLILIIVLISIIFSSLLLVYKNFIKIELLKILIN